MEMRQDMEMRQRTALDRLLATVFKREIEPALFWLTVFTIHWSITIMLPLPQIRNSIFVSVLTDIKPLLFWISMWVVLDIAMVVCLIFELPTIQKITLIGCVFAWTWTVWSYGVWTVFHWPDEFTPFGSLSLLYWVYTFWALGRSGAFRRFTFRRLRLRRGP